MDRFRVEVISQTPNPQQVIYAALHQDYSEGFVFDQLNTFPLESKCGEIIVKRLLAGERGHFGPIEHPSIVLNCGYFPHSVMQQVRTHRVGVSFDVQCLAANTEVTFVNLNQETSPKLRKTIGELYDLWVNGEKAIRKRNIQGRKGEAPGQYRRDCKNRIRKMRLRVLNEETGCFEIGHIREVVCSGVQPVYRVTLEDGKTLDCTANHRLFTSQGWQTMGEAVGLVTGLKNEVLALTRTCEVMCNGIVRNDELYTHKTGLQEQIKLGLTSQQIALLCNCDLSIEPQDWAAKPKPPGKKLRSHPVKVKSVEYLGEQLTYDLEVDGPWHNFVANGMVVHNSNRYTGQRIVDTALGKRNIEEVFYLRPVGYYSDRQGKRYEYTQKQREMDLAWCREAAKRYHQLIEQGLSEEHARGIIPFDVRQHFVVSFNARSLMHLLDLRAKPDAQLECQKLCELIFPHFQAWMPEIAEWYEKTRLKKARLSP